MFVELVYDKRNVQGLDGAREIILAELTKRVHNIFPDAEVKVKPMQANGLNSDASKSDRDTNVWSSDDENSRDTAIQFTQRHRSSFS